MIKIERFMLKIKECLHISSLTRHQHNSMIFLTDRKKIQAAGINPEVQLHPTTNQCMNQAYSA